jgi:hypothetical protein
VTSARNAFSDDRRLDGDPVVLAAGLKLVVVGQDRTDVAGRVEVNGGRQVDAVEGTHLDRVELRGVLKPCTSEWSKRDQRQELLRCGLHALPCSEPAQLDDQQFARMPWIELRECRTDEAGVCLTKCNSAERRRVNVDARHAPLAFAVGR